MEKMGQIVKRKKEREASKVDPIGRRVGEAEPSERDLRRSLRRRNVKYVFNLDDYFDDNEIFEDNDEDQRRRKKKLKLLLKLKNDKDGGSESTPSQTSGARLVAHSSTISASASDGDKPSKKRKIDARDYREIGEDDDENNDIYDDDIL